ncbi:hypothetical protein RJ639_013754 [Escallonia herrerae]|uniref:UDP-glycosyltransferase n=1 Tax=Escallonia herrerae TaxID=1293975 RepID=A0AA89AP07_9ASTE|nr:hypothetical protein RJ639_013754 [Escallonia herrerae]
MGLKPQYQRLLDQLDLQASCIVADLTLPWMKSVGSRRNIPVVSLWPAAPSSFLAFYHSHLLAARGNHPEEDLPAERKEDIIDDLPGVSTVVKDTRIQNLMLKAFSYATKGLGLIFTSFYELEPHIINTLIAELRIPIYTIGPAIPYLSLEDPSSMSIPRYDEECFKWLDLQPEASVLYVSLGSFLSNSNEQMHELSKGLSASGFRYLWVARDEVMSLQESCDNVVGREEISNNVKRLIDLTGEEGKQLRRREKELQETCQRAIEKGGSTDCNTNAFFEDLLHGNLKLPCNGDI